jgi:hypothetical protein
LNIHLGSARKASNSLREGANALMTHRYFLGAMVGVALSSLASAQTAPAPAPQAKVAQPAVPNISRTDFSRDMDLEFDKVDADKNGGVTAKELQDFTRIAAMAAARARNTAWFTALDADKNGQLSAVEFLKLPMKLDPPPLPISLAFDSNRDGKVSKIENRSGTLSAFDRMDSDKDGIVTPAEMKAAGLIK